MSEDRFYCSQCGGDVTLNTIECPHCGAKLNPAGYIRKKAGVAMMASFFIPGFGQIYIGEYGRGFKILIVAITAGLLPAFLQTSSLFYIPYIIIWIFGVYDAVFTTRRHYMGT
ncbi:MAG: hypothetical protein ACXQS2_06265 [Methermicoccaceae archaeon]